MHTYAAVHLLELALNDLGPSIDSDIQFALQQAYWYCEAVLRGFGIGVAGFPDHASTLERLERLADAALYVAKRQGRNRVELADLTAAVPDQAGPSANGAALVPAAPAP